MSSHRDARQSTSLRSGATAAALVRAGAGHGTASTHRREREGPGSAMPPRSAASPLRLAIRRVVDAGAARHFARAAAPSVVASIRPTAAAGGSGPSHHPSTRTTAAPRSASRSRREPKAELSLTRAAIATCAEPCGTWRRRLVSARRHLAALSWGAFTANTRSGCGSWSARRGIVWPPRETRGTDRGHGLHPGAPPRERPDAGATLCHRGRRRRSRTSALEAVSANV